MVQIGVIADTHQPSSQSTTYSGPQGKIATHIDDLVSRGATDVFFAGDNVHPDDDEQENVPHVSPRAYDTFGRYLGTKSSMTVFPYIYCPQSLGTPLVRLDTGGRTEGWVFQEGICPTSGSDGWKLS
jgi:hypothetical protein